MAGMTFITKDSGERAEFDSGMVRDTQEGKPRFDLILPADVPFEEQMLTRWAHLMARGAEKYNDRNWEKAEGPEEYDRFRASAFRHFMQWFCGDRTEDHAAAVFFNVSGAEMVKSKSVAEDEAFEQAMRSRKRDAAVLPSFSITEDMIHTNPADLRDVLRAAQEEAVDGPTNSD